MATPVRFAAAALSLLIAFGAGIWYAGRTPGSAEKREQAAAVKYICPMHPQYTSDRPGIAPCCGMRLEPVQSAGAAGGAPTPAASGAVHISPERQQLIGIQIGQVEVNAARHSIRTPGRVVADETRTFVVNAAADGWIRDVEPFSTGSQVPKDQQLATFYSKEFLTAQQNYFYSLRTLDRLKTSNLEGTEQSTLSKVQAWSNEDILEGLGMGRRQIEELAKTRQFTRSIAIRAPAAGFVLARNVSPGQRFQRGDELYRVADLKQVWILADLFEHEAAHTRPGLPVSVTYRGQRFNATVSEVLPQFDQNSRTLKVRLVAPNPHYVLRPDMFVDVEFPVSLPPAVTVPVEAVLDSGLRKTVFVDRGNGLFEPRAVHTGWRVGSRMEVISGLAPGERIVISGNFLLDSESRMKQALAGIQGEPAKDPICDMDVDRTRAKAAGRTSEFEGTTYYFCSDHCRKSFDKEPRRYLEVPAKRKSGGGRVTPPAPAHGKQS